MLDKYFFPTSWYITFCVSWQTIKVKNSNRSPALRSASLFHRSLEQLMTHVLQNKTFAFSLCVRSMSLFRASDTKLLQPPPNSYIITMNSKASLLCDQAEREQCKEPKCDCTVTISPALEHIFKPKPCLVLIQNSLFKQVRLWGAQKYTLHLLCTTSGEKCETQT